jgi:peptidoglycan/xylan/chitin deacetylase (PgdA/CDA1 family)
MSGLGSGQDGRLGHHRSIWSADIEASVCALTFDDGPDPEFTPRVLDILRSFGITATFNVMGWNALHHTALVKAVIGAGHEIGNHSWSHKDLSTTSYDDTRHEIVYGNEVIEHVSGIKLKYFRPPRGELTGAALRITAELGLDVLLWSLTGSVPGVERPSPELYRVRSPSRAA